MLFSDYYRLNEAEGVNERASMIPPSGSYSAFKWVLYGSCGSDTTNDEYKLGLKWKWDFVMCYILSYFHRFAF